MGDSFKVACVQTNSVRDVAPNIEAVGALVRRAHADGAELIMLPESVNMLEPRGRNMREKMALEEDDAFLEAFRSLAAELGAWILIGSLMLKISDDQAANRSILIDDRGNVAARYDKMHMFDVDVGDGQSYRESRLYRPGDKIVVADTPWGKLGLTVCYDLRFPYLYRALAQAGAEFITVPAAFTRVTGQAHWHVLLRARAIENGCFIFAPAQTGDHAEGRQTFGHSLVVDPWGTVLADGGEAVGIVTAEIDPGLVAKARGKIPSLTHDRKIS
ncbi:MAG: carbon-nitrogen hydrolase family protein [Rhodospirillales bacterium]